MAPHRLLRYQIFLAYGLAFSTCWYSALQNQQLLVGKIAFLPPRYSEIIIQFAPLFLIGLLGIYAIGSVIHGVLNFADCPEAAAEIERQVEEAKRELKEKGVKL